MEPMISNPILFLTIPFFVAALVALATYYLQRWAAAIRRARARGCATRGLSKAQRDQRRAALHLASQRERAIEDLGEDWLLHPKRLRGEHRQGGNADLELLAWVAIIVFLATLALESGVL